MKLRLISKVKIFGSLLSVAVVFFAGIVIGAMLFKEQTRENLAMEGSAKISSLAQNASTALQQGVAPQAIAAASPAQQKPAIDDLVLPANAQAPEMDAVPAKLNLPENFQKGIVREDPSTYFWASWPLNGFKHIDEASLVRGFGIEPSKTFKTEVLLLKQSLVGTQTEKRNSVKTCEKRYGFQGISEFSSGKAKNFILQPSQLAVLTEAPSEKNIGCIYWRILQLSKIEEKSSEGKKPLPGKRSSSPSLAKFQKRLPRSTDEWSKFKNVGYYQALDVLEFKSLKQAQDLLNIALANLQNCEYTNAGAAIVRNLEDYLPDTVAFDLMVRSSDAINKCLAPSDEAYEIVHLRMGLLHLERSQLNQAATHLELALLSESPRDEYRSLFWRGFLEALKGTKDGKLGAQDNVYWTKLQQNFPLTLQALVADEMLGRSPYQRLEKRAAPTVSLFTGKIWDRYNLAQFTSLLLIARSEKVSLEKWSRYLSDKMVAADFSTGLYMALTHLHAGNTRSGIKTVFGIIRDFGNEKLDVNVLELLYPLRYHEQVVKHSKDVDAALVMSLIRQESSFNAKAQSPVGARGLMQVMPTTARSVSKNRNLDLNDPVQNIKVGTAYLAKLLHAHDDNFVYTLASYNAGPRPVNKWRTRYSERIPLLFSDLIPYPETRNYVSGLLRNMYWYRALLDNVVHAKEPRASKLWSAKTLAPLPQDFGIASSANGVTILVDSRKIQEAEVATEKKN